MPPLQRPAWYAIPLLILGIGGFAATWALVAMNYDRQLAWLALLAAADMVLLLGISRWPAGIGRAGAAVLATTVTILLANFCIVAGQLGRGMGLMPWDSALKLGPQHAWVLASLANTRIDLVFYALALLVAGWAGLVARRSPRKAPRT